MRTSTAAKILGVTTHTVRNYLDAGKLEGFALPGGMWRVYRDSLDKLMEGKR